MARFARALALAVVVLGVCAAVLVSPALAHVELERSEPAHGTLLESAPSEVFLRFTGEVQEGSVLIAARGPGGDDVTAGDAQSGGRAAAVGLAELTQDGVYRVRYEGVAADGHRLEGRLRFRLRLGAGALSPAPTEIPTKQLPTVAPTVAPMDTTPPMATAERGTVPWWPFALLLAVAAMVGVTMFRRR